MKYEALVEAAKRNLKASVQGSDPRSLRYPYTIGAIKAVVNKRSKSLDKMREIRAILQALDDVNEEDSLL
jgi:GTP1/Obg family GTP-binding protein